MANIDDIIKKNKQYLTQAQVDALVAASKQYNMQNAGNRAGALATAREQYDTGYRGLQNMGLAGASGAQPTSGEVPRLQQQIRTPFEDYNNRLRDVERQRLGVLGENYAAQTRAAWAAEAERRRQEEAYQRAVAAAQSMLSNIKTSITPSYVGPTLTDAEKAARKAQVDGLKRTQQVQQQTVNAAIKAQIDGMNRTARPQDVAAAAAFNVAHYTSTPVVESANAAQEKGIKLTEKLKGEVDTTNANKYFVGPNKTTFTQAEADVDLKSAQQEYDNLRWKQHYGGKVSKEEMASAQDAVAMAKLKAEKPETYSALAIYNDPAYKGSKQYDNAVGIIAEEEAKALVKQTYGRDIDTSMTYDQFEKTGKDIRQLKDLLKRYDYAEKTLKLAKDQNLPASTIAEDQALVDSVVADLEKMGYTVEKARDTAENYTSDRDARAEIEYYKNALAAVMKNEGKTPTKPVNEKETDPTYRAVNNLSDIMRKKSRFVDYLPGAMSNAAITDQEFSAGGIWGKYMTADQKDTYNAIYEKEGVKAANLYLDAIRPLINIQHAQQDAEYAKELANDKVGTTILANLGSVPIRAAGSIPAVLEKYIVGGLNALSDMKTGGAGVPMYIDTNSPAHQLSNFASSIRSETSKRIIESNSDNPVLGQWANKAYGLGMSMADSAFNMAFGIAGAPWMTGLLAGSDAANEAYKDARARGGTQQQAMAVATAAGIAENLFETVSLEYFTNQWIEKGAAWTRPFIVKWGLGAGVEGSEEVFTSASNLLSDIYIMKDKSEWQEIVDKHGPEGLKDAILEEMGNLGADFLGGAISGGVFGLFGGAFNGVRSYAETTQIGKQAESLGYVQKYRDMATVLGGKASKTESKLGDSPSNHSVGKLVNQVNNQLAAAFTGNEKTDIPMALMFSGKQLSFTEANDVYQALGAETLEKMGYATNSARSFMESYNKRMVDSGIYNRVMQQQKERMENMANAEAEEHLTMTDQLGGTEYGDKQNAWLRNAKEAAENKVWKNPRMGMAIQADDGTDVPVMPGNMTAIEFAEMQRKNFQARTTVTKGRATYELASMQARQGLSNEQVYNEMRANLKSDIVSSADFYENLANNLGLDVVIHDVMPYTNGFLKDGKLHVVLGSRQNAVRIASHELTHYIKSFSPTKFNSLQNYLIADVGQKKFDRMVAQKAAQYGFDTEQKSGLENAREEVCAELCERMLSNEEMLQRFAQRDTATAKTMNEHLSQTLDTIKRVIEDQGDDFGEKSGLIKDAKTIDSWIDGLTSAIAAAEEQKKTMAGQVAVTAGVTEADHQNLVQDLSEAKTEEEFDEVFADYSVDVIAYDMAGYMQDLADHGVMTQKEIDDLFDTMNEAITMVKANRAILDFGAELDTEEDILKAKRERAYLPYKQNADPHYKLALDFSTLCRKRVLLQTIQERLQAKMGRALTQEETVAIRLELQKLQREGFKVEVACALCYVEAARLKSPKVINTFLNNTGNEMRNYFAKKNPASKDIIEGLQQQWKVKNGLSPYATKADMKAAGVNVTDYNNYSREKREQFESDNAAEKVTIDRAVRLANNEKVMIGGIEFPGRETFLSASWLTKLKSVEPDIFNAFTDKVRSATRSKAQETDTFYSRGDIDMVTESILNYANAESGFRHQSWSDFVPTHLLDTMAAVIEMSTRDAKMHAYTKVPSMVRLLGKTGMALNMSLIPAGDTGLVNGELSFDSVEGMPWETMMELRDMFPDTAGNIAIGINGEQIQKLLSSNDIDYVIPYHASGMNKNMRGYLDIRAWSEYTSSQNEKTNHRGTKGAAPELAEWFDEKAAAKAEDGYAFMRAASEKYLQLCYERNLTPKFSQYLTNNGDGSYSLKEGYENYWKMLTDRKMVNQKTGKVIIQDAVKPVFDKDTVLGILEDRLEDPAIQDAEKAAKIVGDKFSGWQADRNNADAEAIQEAKNIRDRTAAITAQKTAEAGGVNYSLDTDYMDLAKRYSAGKASMSDIGELQRSVEQAAKQAGYNSPKLYHGTTAFGFTKFDLAKGGGLIFASSDRNTASTYSGETDRTRIKDRFTGDVDALRGDELIQTANKYLDNRYEGFDLITDAQKKEYADRIRRTIDESIKKGERYVNAFNDVSSDEKKIAVMNRLLDSLLEIRAAETQTELQHAYDQWDRGLFDLRFIDEDTCDEFIKQCKASNIGMICQRYLRALLYSGDIYGYVDGDTLSFRYDNTIKAELDSELRRGIYSLYGKLGRNLEIDANGAYWDEITAPKELHMDGLQKTRSIAEKAFALGYDSITIKNLKDNGGQTGYQGAGDIYIFNAKNAVKSADPVTYNDNGDIIPLSERFNTEKEDFRYSLDDDAIREAFTSVYQAALEGNQEQLRDLPAFLDTVSNGNAELRKALGEIFTKLPESKPKQEARATKPGYKPQGKGPVARDISVPEVAKNGKRVSDFTRSFLESNKATDEIASELLSKVESGEWGGYTRLTNEEAMDRAKEYIAKRQIVAAQQDFHDMVMSGKYNVNTRALGLQLLTEAAQRGDKVALLDIASDLRVLATDAGQSVQIFSVLKDLGGVGSSWYLQKVVERLNTKYADQIASGKMNEIVVPRELYDQLEQAQTTQDVTAAEKVVAKNIADQLPLTWADRFSNWRYMAMLANPTTHARNLFGNLLMGTMNMAKDAVATGIERIGVRDQSKRTHAVLTFADKKAMNSFAEQSYKENEGILRASGKFSFESEIKQNMRSFDTKALNAVSQFNFNALEQEDMWFIKPAYKNALMQYLKAQGYTLQGNIAGKTVNGEFKHMTKAQMAQAVEYATEQAWKATFHDASALADMLNKISKMNTASRLIVEGVMPFKKTPINIAKRGVEYSPVGIIMGTVQLMRDVKKGKVTTAHAIDNLASGITGTTLMAIGMFLSRMGLVRVGDDDDKKLSTYKQDTGDQTYSLKIGKLSFSLSALAPATIPLFMGAAFNEMVNKSGGDLDLSTVTNTISGTLNPFMEMSFMSSLNSALKNYGKEGIGGALGNSILTSAENYFSQYLPTAVAKAGQLADPTARTTKSSATSPIGSGMDYYARSLAKKIPGVESMLQPDVNVWGRKTEKDSFEKWALDFANKFILPFNVKVENRDAVDDELIRLVESTGEVNILPSDGPKYFTVKGEKYSMSAEQYTEYSIDRGQASYAALSEVMSSQAYQDATDEQKTAMLENALSAAQKNVNNMWKERLGATEPTTEAPAQEPSKQEAPKQETVKEMKGDYSDPALYAVAAKYPNAYDKAAKAKSKGVSPDTFMSLYEKKESYIGDDRADYMRREIMASNLTAKQKELMDDLIISDKGQNPDYSSQAWFDVSMLGKTNYDKAKKGEKLGITPETYLAAYKKSKEISAAKLGNKKKATVTKYLDSLNLSASSYDYLMANIFGYTR